MRTTGLLAATAALALTGAAAAQDAPTLDEINAAAYDPETTIEEGVIDPVILKAQVLLDRAHISPGVIDGYIGENVAKSIRAFETMKGLPVDGELDPDVWSALGAANAEAVFRTYEIAQEDVDGPFVESIPEDYAELAEMDRIAYRGPFELLAEKFHMDQDLLSALNPGASFERGETIVVAAVTEHEADAKIDRIEVSRGDGALYAYGEDGSLVYFAPATVGSEQLPSPTGTHQVKAIAVEPNYTYQPDVNFQQGDNDETLILPPGPNNPVGIVWIDLSEPTYGIHGTPEPALIDKTYSHGCVRLTNWDARELAGMVEEGDTVAFVD